MGSGAATMPGGCAPFIVHTNFVLISRTGTRLLGSFVCVLFWYIRWVHSVGKFSGSEESTELYPVHSA